ncbi:tape measure protein [Acinetobacter guillouiae]|uniref:tape measure protein n=1 Tax=Acinetobacter guillouiae TaxID=106649 RepID=UPI003AF9B535
MASKLGTLTLDLICRTGNFTQGMRDASNSANRELGRIEQSTNGATNAIKGMAVAALGAFSIHQVIAYTDSYTNLQNRLKLVTNSQQELNTATKDTFAIAQATAQSWGTVAQVYQRFAENSSRLGITMQQTASLTDTVSKAISISGASASSAEAALMQFSQALASGVLRGEEFNSIAEQAPALLKAIATGLGVNIGELRKMAGEGQLTGDVVIKALNKAKTSVDDLFSKTDFTIAQSFTQLNDSVTKFVGEAGSGSGAAKTLASSIKLVADNVDTIADAAMVGGVAFLTKTVISQTIAMKESIAVSIQRRLADIAALESQVRLSMVEVLRTKAKVGELAAERNLIVAKLRTNISTQERIALETRATQVAIQLAVAERNMAAATAQRTLAQNTLNASTAIGSRVLGVVGGPIGLLTIGVAGLAAGYMYMQNQTAKATEKLAEQTDVANKTKEELLALQGVQKNGAKSDLQDAFKGQNKELKELNYVFNAHLIELQDAYKGNLQIVEISNKVRLGVMSQEEALKKLNKLDFISPDQLKQLQKDNDLYREKLPIVQKVQEALRVFGVNSELAGNKATNASKGINDIAKEAITTSEKVKALDGAIQKFISNSLSSSLQNEEKLKLYNKGLTNEAADLILKAREAAGIIGTDQQLPLGALTILGRELLTTTELKRVEDERTQLEKERTKELERQQKVREKHAALLASSNEQTRNMLKVYQAFLNAGVDDVKARVLTSQVGREGDFLSKNLYGNHTDAANGKTNTGFISWQGERSKSLIDYLRSQGVLDSKGNIQQTQEALDAQAKFFIQEVMSQKRYLPSKNALVGTSDNYRELEQIFGKNAIAWDYAGNSIGKDKASKNLARQDSYYAKLGKLLGENPDSFLGSFKDLSKQDDDVYKLKTRIEDEKKSLIEFYDDWQKLENDNAKQVKDIQEKFANDPVVRDRLLALQSKAYQEDVENYIKAGDDRVKADYQATQEIIAARQAAFDNINNPIYSMRDKGVEAQAQASMTPIQYQSWQLNKEQQDGYASLGNDLIDSVNAINESQILSEQEKYDQLKSAHEDYVNSKASLDLLYDKQTKDLARSQTVDQLNMWGGILSTAQNTFSQLAQSAKDGAGEQSSVYKTMFGLQKAFSVASSIVAAWQAYVGAFADPSAMTLPQKFAGGAAVMAALMPAITTISSVSLQGMAHDGIDNIPREGTWLLDGGERVLNPQQNKDLTSYLSNNKSGNGVTVNVNVPNGYTAKQSRDSNGNVTIDIVEQKIAEAIDSIGNPNSTASRTIQNAFGLAPAR